jgi:hypothetical protein
MADASALFGAISIALAPFGCGGETAAGSGQPASTAGSEPANTTAASAPAPGAEPSATAAATASATPGAGGARVDRLVRAVLVAARRRGARCFARGSRGWSGRSRGGSRSQRAEWLRSVGRSVLNAVSVVMRDAGDESASGVAGASGWARVRPSARRLFSTVASRSGVS